MKKIIVEEFSPKIFILKLSWTFYITNLFQSIPANLPVEQLTSLWGREWVPQTHLNPPERGYWPKADEKITYYLKALKRNFLKIDSSCSSTSNLNQWPPELMTTMNASSRKRHFKGTKYFHNLNEVHSPIPMYSVYTRISTYQTKCPPFMYSFLLFPWRFLITGNFISITLSIVKTNEIKKIYKLLYNQDPE